MTEREFKRAAFRIGGIHAALLKGGHKIEADGEELVALAFDEGMVTFHAYGRQDSWTCSLDDVVALQGYGVSTGPGEGLSPTY